jgi:hypothetical protein
MEVTVLKSGSDEADHIDIITKTGLIVFNLETLEDGQVIDGRFALAEKVDFLDKEGNLIPHIDILAQEEIIFHGQKVKISPSGPKLEAQIAKIIEAIEIPTKGNMN